MGLIDREVSIGKTKNERILITGNLKETLLGNFNVYGKIIKEKWVLI
jgi:hypothetical protein